MYYIKSLLSAYKGDSTVIITRQADTIVAGEKCYQFKLTIPNYIVDYQEYKIVRLIPYANEISYVIAIGKKDFVPRYFSKREGSYYRGETTYANIRFNEQLPNFTWSLARFPKEYARVYRQKRQESAPEISVNLRTETATVKGFD